jgi:hypothetical protein
MDDPRDLAEVLDRLAATVERQRQEARAHPAYRNRYLGRDHRRLEAYARRLLHQARDGGWHRFYAASPDDAATVDQCIRYIVRQERPAESVRVEWLRRDGAWSDRFPRRPVDRYRLSGRGPFPAAGLAELARVQDAAGAWWYAGRLHLGPKRGTVPPPASPRPSRSAAEMLHDAITGRRTAAARPEDPRQ